ncbi:JmjC domain [Lasallia pustulata]|uniref:JmjC domain n=1 Tax=Lasallia pustulata TaxID=136370 RepID=A0A1W5D572_9LECA|nr:JmjC domain [Lasallia pustulata]
MSLNINLSVKQAIIEHILSYQELNGTTIDELQNEPSPLEFMRFCAKNRPFTVRGGASEWPAVQHWNVEYLKQALGTKLVNVAVTPNGNADSVVMNPEDGITYFVKPLEIEEPFGNFLDYVKDQELGAATTQAVRYAQTQNDNLRGEYSSLYKEVEMDIAWARIALGRQPDAVNLWIGNSRSITSLHRDNYENVYCQVVGRKHFVLLPPVEMACINEKLLTAATYAQKPSTTAVLGAINREDLQIVPDIPEEMVPCATWDPDDAMRQCSRFSHLSKPLRVDLNPGDMLYLPALW